MTEQDLTIICAACGHEASRYRKIEFIENRHYDVELVAHGHWPATEIETRTDGEHDDDVIEIEYRCWECGGNVTREVDELLRQIINEALAASLARAKERADSE